MLNIYRVKLLNDEIPCNLRQWDIVATNLQAAWQKFARQHFGPLGPNPADYDISFSRLYNNTGLLNHNPK